MNIILIKLRIRIRHSTVGTLRQRKLRSVRADAGQACNVRINLTKDGSNPDNFSYLHDPQTLFLQALLPLLLLLPILRAIIHMDTESLSGDAPPY